MGFIGGELGYRLLRALAPRVSSDDVETAYSDASKIGVLLGESIWDELRGKDVLDFGCGKGEQATELALRGAKSVFGLDILEGDLAIGRRRAIAAGVADRVSFGTGCTEPVDAIISLDAFEHFEDPASILVLMHTLLKPGGRIYASFGPTWYHPYGGHLFSVFPLAHLVFTERALIRWRSEFKTDGATRFHEVEGGLNRMTIGRFERLVEQSPLHCEELVPMPIRKLRPLANRWTREFTTAVVRARLVRPVGPT
jgi:SAM-dependent methyltransferase